MRLLAVTATAALLAASASAEIKDFKNWSAGCDNIGTCTAVGFAAEDGFPTGFVHVTRSGGAEAKPAVRLVVLSEAAEGDAALAVTLNGKSFGKGSFPATSDGTWTRADLNEADAAAFLAEAANATSLTIKRTDSTDPAFAVSLDGSSASLRYMDAEQKRDGGVTAIVAKGDKPASAVPAPPALPVVKATNVKSLETNPPVPKALPAGNPEDCNGMDDTRFAVDLGDGHTLWGVCVFAGAYNYGYEIYIADKAGKVTPVKAPPGSDIDSEVLTLVNPYAPDGGKTIEAFNKGRGLGDCGDSSAHAWNGKELVLVRQSQMNNCRGVGEAEWISLYTATVE